MLLFSIRNSSKAAKGKTKENRKMGKTTGKSSTKKISFNIWEHKN